MPKPISWSFNLRNKVSTPVIFCGVNADPGSYFIITENHKGTLSVRSQLGKGSTFSIELPINP